MSGLNSGRVKWRLIVSLGALWAVVYNVVWGVAWLAFMRREWEDAFMSIHKQMPFSAEVWFAWALVTVPIGCAVMRFAAGPGRTPRKDSLLASAGVWLIFTLGMAGWGVGDDLPSRVVVLDSVVNLLALMAAAFAATWSRLSP